jgi:FlaA1/EpsC-like NDP-sugar epimerase
MSTDEAVRLVLRAAAITRGRHVLALEMGEQVNIYELAERMIRLCGYQPVTDIPIAITGILPGENLSEQVIGNAERRERSDDGPIVTIAPVPVPCAELDEWLSRLETLAISGDHDAARAALLGVAARALPGGDADEETEDRLRSAQTRS